MYSEYFSIYSQYLSYFATVIILLCTTTALSIINVIDKKRMYWVKILFIISFLLTAIDIYFVFDIYNNLRTIPLLMSGNCHTANGKIVCDLDIQKHSSYLKYAIGIAILSFILLIIGYFLKIWSKNEK